MSPHRSASRFRLVSASLLATSLLVPVAGCQGSGSPEAMTLAESPVLPALEKEDFTAMYGGTLDAWEFDGREIRIAQPGKGGWLRTKKMYRDFVVSFDVMIPEGGNSGVGLRCTGVGDPAFTGFEVQILDSHGQEPDVHHAGAVYNAIAPATQAIKPPGEWNTYSISVKGDTLDVWINGVHVQQDQKLDDRGFFRQPDQKLPLNERATTGYIAFQDHGEGGLRLRDIRIDDFSPDPDPGDFEPAFNERDTTGWTHRGGGRFFFENGTLVAADGPGHLFSERTHTDIELHALVRVAEPNETGAARTGNGGIYFRTVPRPENPDTWPLGYEAQIDHHDVGPLNYTGCIYDYAPAYSGGPISEDGEWFDYRIIAVGEKIRTYINGVLMADTQLSEFSEGHVAFQTHHPGNRIEFRDVRWRVPTAEDLDR